MIKRGLTSNQLKIIAISAMLLDHIVAAFISHETMWGMALRIPGRITAPIMCYLMSEGFHYTSDKKKYLLRMFLLCGIEGNYPLYLRGDNSEPIAYIEASIFGNENHFGYKELPAEMY